MFTSYVDAFIYTLYSGYMVSVRITWLLTSPPAHLIIILKVEYSGTTLLVEYTHNPWDMYTHKYICAT